MTETPSPPHAAPDPRAGRGVEFKAALLVLAMVALVAASAVYLMYARGVFERTQSLTLVTDDAEGVVIGMDMTFSGFPIGRVRRVELATDGRVHVLVDVPLADAHWLRETSVFVLARGLVGDTRLRAYSGVLGDPPLAAGATRDILRGDATTEIPRLVSAARDLVQNLGSFTGGGSALSKSLDQVQVATEKLNGPRGALGLAFGNDRDAQQLVAALERSNKLLTRLDGLVGRTDGLVARADGVVGRADAQVFGQDGLMTDARASVQQLGHLLRDSRESLRKVDAVLAEAQGAAKNVRGATTDLDALRNDVEANLRRIDSLILDIQRKWPFARDAEIKLP